jgi:ribonuclease HI
MTLVKSVLNAIPNYYMQVNWLPQTTCDKIDQLARNFLWKGSSNKGIHLVGWDKITKPKNLGGLGIRRAREANTSLLGKLVWNIHQDKDSLWVQILKHKYLKEEPLLHITKKAGSTTWNAIMKALSVLKEGYQFRLGNGNSSFWFSNWSGSGILANQVLFVDIHDLEMRVCDVFTDGSWRFNVLYTDLAPEVKERVNSITIDLNSEVSDRYTWNGNLNGIYTAQDGYYWLNRQNFNHNPSDGISWSWLWQLPAPEKIKFLLWSLIHKALPTRGMLSHRGITPHSLCPRCNIHEETMLHCLRDCELVKFVWRSIGYSAPEFFMENDHYAWIRGNLRASSMFTYLAAVWCIWRARNLLCFNNEVTNTYSLRLRIEGLGLLLQNGHGTNRASSSHDLVRWNALDGTGMILNVDGSSKGNPGVSGYGGLIRNAGGAWVHGFFGNLGVTTILHAELMAIYKGLLLAWELNIKDLWCYSDSKIAIKLITDTVDEWHHYAALVTNIKAMLRRDWRVVLLHTLREGNSCADFLAKHGANSNDNYVSLANPPVGLNLHLLADASGTWFSR